MLYAAFIVHVVAEGDVRIGFYRCVATGSVAVAAAMLAGGLVSGPAGAAPSSFADQTVSKVTDDGYRLTVTKAQEKLESVPPLNQSPWTREGFLSLKGIVDIGGTSNVPVTAGTVSTGVQVGCNTDVTSGITLGMSISPSVGLTVSWPPAGNIGLSASPQVSTTLKPGTIANIPLGTKQLAAGRGGITTDGIHLKTDGCLGPVSIRTYVSASISTPLNDNTAVVCGKPHYL